MVEITKLQIEKGVQRKRENYVKMKGRPLHSMVSLCLSYQLEKEERHCLCTFTFLLHNNACQKLYKAHCHNPILLPSTVFLGVFRSAKSLTVCFKLEKNFFFLCWAKTGRGLEEFLAFFSSFSVIQVGKINLRTWTMDFNVQEFTGVFSLFEVSAALPM